MAPRSVSLVSVMMLCLAIGLVSLAGERGHGPQPGAPKADHAVVWAPPQQFLDEQAGLKGIFNIGAGVDAMLNLKLPQGAMLVVETPSDDSVPAISAAPAITTSAPG